MRCSNGYCKRSPHFSQIQFEKACYVALRFGATFAQLERDFDVPDVGWRILRVQLMDRFKLSLAQVEALRDDPTAVSDMLGYISALNKAQEKK